jgi:hypothetical protein
MKKGGLFECCAKPSNATFGVSSLPSVQEWLESMKLGHVYVNFQEAGYEDYEFILWQMFSRHPITDTTLRSDVKIGKPGYR